MSWVLTAVFGYLMGSVAFGVLIGRWVAHMDIRTVGSGNIGVTNVYRTLGKGPAVLVFLGDGLKGVLPVLLGLRLGGDIVGMVGGVSAILGHSYPLYFGFKGGRGVATACGVILALTPLVAVLSLLIFVITLLAGRWVSLASIVGIICAVILTVMTGQSSSMLILMTVCALIILYRHRPNIKRLLNGTEPKIELNKSGKKG
jgi:glycerol-3-phosphate acyltransferase PlsY